jgi:hypothetical protein
MLNGTFSSKTDEICKQLDQARRTYVQWRAMLEALDMTDAVRACERVESDLEGAYHEAKYFRGEIAKAAKDAANTKEMSA